MKTFLFSLTSSTASCVWLLLLAMLVALVDSRHILSAHLVVVVVFSGGGGVEAYNLSTKNGRHDRVANLILCNFGLCSDEVCSNPTPAECDTRSILNRVVLV